MLDPRTPSLALAPMDGITDAPMRALQGKCGSFDYAVSEFIRVSGDVLPKKVFRRDVPEICEGSRTRTGLPVQVQILGGDPELMALSALNAWKAGATAIDINFGCPAPVVNRHDGGASLLRQPCRIREVVSAVRQAVPAQVPVSAKLRLGWDDPGAIDETAAMAEEGGASWITIHARTRMQGYAPPVFWKPIGRVRRRLGIPVVANGDIWSLEDFCRCREETECRHYMLGRCALADPILSHAVSKELGLERSYHVPEDWTQILRELVSSSEVFGDRVPARALMRLKQWLKIASNFGRFPHFDLVKRATTVDELFATLEGVPAEDLRLAEEPATRS
ncbi:MAG TPA: tRNA-dihydrouridine synthase family protein, partial [Fimbriimonadaceae bacterium]|nr:tRNA-dihydrouridine synthase family protein [Fimbriimonadaceae bacterium]